ncbi:MAG: helix-turn-helix transcriptional regulator [Bacteroidales bacterium]|nr:helix-turn-helix transcriptional regulator [Bacteroidales bacterium]
MKERIREFLLAENKSSAQLAEEIGVQPSGISHILSGRNKPSLDFVLKMLEKYDHLRTDWLLFGKGSMYKEPVMGSLFDEAARAGSSGEKEEQRKNMNLPEKRTADSSQARQPGKLVQSDAARRSELVRIVWFYADNNFEEYFPQQK